MQSLQHQFIIEFVTTAECEESAYSNPMLNRMRLAEVLDNLINYNDDLKQPNIGLIEARITDSQTAVVDSSIRRRRNRFYNHTITFDGVRNLWNNALRRKSIGNAFYDEDQAIHEQNVINQYRSLIVASVDNDYRGYTFYFPELEELNEDLWIEIQNTVRTEVNKLVNDTIEKTILSHLDSAYEDGLIHSIREATVNRHIKEAMQHVPASTSI